MKLLIKGDGTVMAVFLLGVCVGIWFMVFAEWYDNRKGGDKK